MKPKTARAGLLWGNFDNDCMDVAEVADVVGIDSRARDGLVNIFIDKWW